MEIRNIKLIFKNNILLDALIILFFGSILLFGAIMNIYVIYRMRCFKRRNREQVNLFN